MVTLTPFQWVMVGTHVALLTLAFGYRSSMVSEQTAHQKTRIELAHSQASAAVLQTAILKQNAAITELKTQQAAKEAEASKHLDRARADARSARKQAADLLARPQPQGVDSCTAAAQLFDEVVHAR